MFTSVAVARGIMMVYGTTPKLMESGTYTFGCTVA
jgi:hypothetical protein